MHLLLLMLGSREGGGPQPGILTLTLHPENAIGLLLTAESDSGLTLTPEAENDTLELTPES